MGEIRRGSKVFEKGEFVPVFCGHDAIAYKRCDGNSQILVAVNAGCDEQELYVGGEWDNAYSYFGECSSGGVLRLAPYRYAMLGIV